MPGAGKGVCKLRVMKKIFLLFIITAFIFINQIQSGICAPHWKKMPIRVYIEDNPKEYIMKKAFNKWKTASNGLVSFEFVSSPAQADISVEFTNNLDGTAVGLCSYGGVVNGYFTKNTIYLARSESTFNRVLTTNEYYRIMLHEIGHALGLPHSDNVSSIMKPTTTQILTITKDDLKDLRKLYNN